MKWSPPDVVALILALCVLVFVVSGAGVRPLLYILVGRPVSPVSPEAAAAWESVINVIIGVLAAYISGRAASNISKGPPPDG